MKISKKLLRTAGGGLAAATAAVALTVSALPASADEANASGASSASAQGTIIHEYPETPALNPKLPITKTTHKNDHIKANILNPHPVCNALEDKRTTVYKVTDNFLPIGTVSTTNSTNKSIPVTQTTSKSQSLALSVNGSRNENTSVNFGGAGKHTNLGIAWSLAEAIAGSASYNLSWSVGQTIGPYEVPAGHTGDATYGFRAINMTGTQQHCKADGTWSNPTAWTAFAPIKNEVRVKTYSDAADSDQSGKPGPQRDKPAPKPVVKTTEAKTAAEDCVKCNTSDNPGDFDLEPVLTVSDAKVSGYAGLVALKLKNVGTEHYFDDDQPVSFRVDVKTEEGPKGVDRLITPNWFNGAHVQDLGFDKKASTRSFLVTLSNPVKKGDTQLVANFNFGDGNTKEGRLKNSISVTQVDRLEEDVSFYNDQDISSTTKGVTLNDRGKASKSKGIF